MKRMARLKAGMIALALAAGSATGVQATPNDTEIRPGTELGPVTNLPIPRFVSLKVDEGNVRRGPSKTHRIDWVFQRRNMPLEITGEYGNWRRVRDRDGAGGWVHYSLLSGMRTVIVQKNMLPLLKTPDPDAPVNAQAEIGVVARLGECLRNWCRITAENQRGWVPKSTIWGVNPEEVRD